MSDSESADVTYAAYTSGFTIVHGNGPDNIDPGFPHFPSLGFDVPEPGTALLLSLGLLGLLGRRRA